jgi:predicted phage terminase large subunit-like protein
LGIQRTLNWVTANLFGYLKVNKLEISNKPTDMVDITVEPSHEFLVKCGGNWIRTHNCIIDDPHSEQDAIQAISSPEVYDRVFEWYKSGPRQRLQPGGNIILVATRWSKRDLTGQLLLDQAKGGEKWKHINFPAILPSGKPLWPEFWSLKALLATKEAISLQNWNAQYLQNPTSEMSAIVKRSDWMRWEDEYPPEPEFVLQTVDTAFEKNQRADYSVIATWGIFYQEDEDTGIEQANIILMNVLRERCEFPRLKIMIADEWREYRADKLLIEKKASGSPLIYELRAAGIPCSEFTPNRATGDKVARLSAVTDVFASHRVWAPYRMFADELIEEVASFPNGTHDDQVDCVSMAIAYFRQGGFIRNTMDEPEETQYFKSKRTPAYY